MTLEKFILEYDTAGDKDKFLKSCVKNTYMPFAEKEALCGKIIAASCYRQVGENRVFEVNHIMRYFLFVTQILANYTKIEFELDKAVEVYDALGERHILNKLLTYINEEEYKELSTLLSMKYDSEVANNTNLVAFASRKFEELGVVIDALIKNAESVEGLDA